MYNENLGGGGSRLSWSYSYKGRELIPFVRRKYEEFKVKESASRDKMAIMIKDPISFHDDRELQSVKADIDRLSAVREQLEVLHIELRRNPERDFTLQLSDVVFFGIHLSTVFEGLEQVTSAWKQVAELEREKKLLEDELNRITMRQERVARQLEVLRAKGPEGKVRAKFVAELDQHQDRVVALSEELSQKKEAILAARRAAQEKLDHLPILPFTLPGDTPRN